MRSAKARSSDARSCHAARNGRSRPNGVEHAEAAVARRAHDCVVYDRDSAAITEVASIGAIGASSFPDLVERLRWPRAIWLMIPAAAVDSAITELARLLAADDVLVDGGNSFYQDDIRRAKLLGERGIHHLDVGTSGGVWGGRERVLPDDRGEAAIVNRLESIFAAMWNEVIAGVVVLLASLFRDVPASDQGTGVIRGA
jgi:6-phosphogluconate dehydrogenase (decarboxylating)